jgi:hypothetical protein
MRVDPRNASVHKIERRHARDNVECVSAHCEDVTSALQPVAEAPDADAGCADIRILKWQLVRATRRRRRSGQSDNPITRYPTSMDIGRSHVHAQTLR